MPLPRSRKRLFATSCTAIHGGQQSKTHRHDGRQGRYQLREVSKVIAVASRSSIRAEIHDVHAIAARLLILPHRIGSIIAKIRPVGGSALEIGSRRARPSASTELGNGLRMQPTSHAAMSGGDCVQAGKRRAWCRRSEATTRPPLSARRALP